MVKIYSSAPDQFSAVVDKTGVGKTALASWLVWNRPCAFYFTRLPSGPSPEKTRRSLAAQLILGWGLRDDLLAAGGQFPARCDDPAWLVEVLDRVAGERDRQARHANQPPRPLVLVVDGLDEAEAPVAGRDTGVPLGLPNTSAAGLPSRTQHRTNAVPREDKCPALFAGANFRGD